MAQKVLVIEDEESLRQVLHEKLKESGFEVSESENGENGLDAALASHPDIILLDIIMPRMDGMTMLRKLREDEWGKNAKVIILSNLSDAQEVSEAMKNGVYDYLVKTDWKLDDLMVKIKEKLA